MTRLLLRALPGLALLALAAPAAAQVTGLSGWSVYLDPGHGENENVGVFNYSEARKVLRVGLALREILLSETDIDTVYMSRTTDGGGAQNPGLQQRVDHANQVGAAFFHSIHSNAAAPEANSVFVLWPQQRSGAEGVPNGGRAMALLMGPGLAQGMRIPAANNGTGAFGECDFYGASSCGTGPKGSRNFVQRNTNMASALSEAGFHTNPRQNQRNMNAEWKRLEARAMYWAMLAARGIARPAVRIATGIVSDAESGLPINGATVTVGGRTYTTDTFASLFNQYSSDPDELRNGFYYLEGMPSGSLPVTVTAPGYGPFSGTLTIRDDDFSVLDIGLVTLAPPSVTETVPAAGGAPHPITRAVSVAFSRPMNRAATEAAFSLTATDGGTPLPGAFAWAAGDRRLTFTPAQPLAPETAHTLTVAASAQAAAGTPLDGDADGQPGGAFELAFSTGFLDTAAPRLVASFPAVSATGIDRRPVVTVVFNERVDPATLAGRVTFEQGLGGALPGRWAHAVVGERSTVSFAPDAALNANQSYRFALETGVQDLFLNPTTSRYIVPFRTETPLRTVTPLEDFEGDFAANWWAPQQSGSTVGIVTDSTGFSASTDLANVLAGQQAMALRYGWAETGPWLIREYLNSGPAFGARFPAEGLLQAYVFGDGSGTLFRFAVDDGCAGGGCAGTEVSPWTAVDWVGWRPVSWDLSAGQTGTWIGNGTLDGTLRFDSIQLSYAPGGARFGRIAVDDLRLVAPLPVSSEDGAPAPGEALAVSAPHPNPTRGAVSVRLGLAAPGEVSARVYNALGQQVAVLAADAPFAAGAHEIAWDASGVAAGVYVVRVEAAGEVRAVRLTVAR